MNTLNVGIVGCGLISKKRHIPAFLKTKNVNLVAVCDLNYELAKNIAKEFKIPRAYQSLTDMLENESLDIVDICTPPQVHAPIAIEAIENGCHILMEKPMALSVEDCDKMIDASKTHGVEICTVHNNLFHPPLLRAKELIASGEVGKVHQVNIFLSTPNDDLISFKDHWVHKLPGGIIGETGPHIAYMVLNYFQDIENVNVLAKNYLGHSWAKYDEFNIQIETKNGFSQSTISYTNDYWAAYVEIIGTKECLQLDLEAFTLTRFKRKDLEYDTLAKSSASVSTQLFSNIFSNAVNTVFKKINVGHDILIQRFVNALIEGEDIPVSAEEGRNAVKLMEKIVDSLNTCL